MNILLVHTGTETAARNPLVCLNILEDWPPKDPFQFALASARKDPWLRLETSS